MIANETSRVGTQLQLGVFQEGNRIYFGITFSLRQPIPHPVREVNEFWKGLAPEWTRQGTSPSTPWLCYRPVSIDMNSHSFFLTVASGGAVTLTQPVTDDVVDFLRDNQELLLAASRALSNFNPDQKDPDQKG